MIVRIILSILFIFCIKNTYCEPSIQELIQLKGIDRVIGFENYYYLDLLEEHPKVVFNHAKMIENLSKNDRELLMVFRYIELLYWTGREERVDLRNKYGKELDSLFKIMPPNETLAYLKANVENVYGYSIFIETGTPSAKVLQLLQSSILFYQKKGFDKIANINVKLNNLGNVYLKSKMYDNALFCFTQSINNVQKTTNKGILIHSYNGLGLSYMNLKEYDAAIDAFKKGKNLSEEANNFLAVGFLVDNIAKCYLRLGKLTEAKSYFLTEIQLLDDDFKKGNNLSLADAHSCLTLIAALMNNKEEVNMYADKAESYMNSVDSIELKKYYEVWVNYNENMTLAFKQIGEKDRGLASAIRWLEALKTMNERAKSTEILQLATEFNTELYKAQKKEADDKRKVFLYGLIASIIINIIAFIWLSYVYVKFRRQIGEMAQNEKKLLLEKETTDALLAELKENEKNMTMSLSSQNAESQLLTQELAEKLAIIEELNTQLVGYKQKEIQEDLVYDKTAKMIEELKTLVITEKNWERFIIVLEQAYPNFLQKVETAIPALTPADIRLLALLKLKLDTRQISEILGISVSSIYTSKYRLRQKVKHLPQGDEISLMLK